MPGLADDPPPEAPCRAKRVGRIGTGCRQWTRGGGILAEVLSIMVAPFISKGATRSRKIRSESSSAGPPHERINRRPRWGSWTVVLTLWFPGLISPSEVQ